MEKTNTKRHIAILGSTGSIGTQALEVIAANPDAFELEVLTANGNADLLIAQALQFRPNAVVIGNEAHYTKVKDALFDEGIKVFAGEDALAQIVEMEDIDMVLTALVGYAGLRPTLAAIRAGKHIALANKETLVVAGNIVHDLLKTSRGEILPVDSEHSAIFQCLAGRTSPKRIILTASGGPFRDWTTEQMHSATIAQALTHPTWRMGKKITIDSATMMNKALEIIEARWLFDVPSDRIEVIIHPQSIIHSMIETEDGSMIAQLSPPDMRLPIQLALTHPRCVAGATATLDLTKNLELTLLPVDRERFPAISLGFEVARVGGTAGAVVNAANEEAVGLFLDGRIRFTDIVPACQNALDHHNHEHTASIQRLLELDRWARAEVRRWQARSISST